MPSVSLLAEFPVAVVDKVADAARHAASWPRPISTSSTRPRARRSSPNGNRVHDDAVAEIQGEFPDVRLVTVDDVFGGWDKVQNEHFASGGLLDKLYGSR